MAERAIESRAPVTPGRAAGNSVCIEDSSAPKEPQICHFWPRSKASTPTASLARIYEDFSVNSKNYMSKSRGTEAFIAEFERLTNACVRAAGKGPRSHVRKTFELLFDFLRRLDEGGG